MRAPISESNDTKEPKAIMIDGEEATRFQSIVRSFLYLAINTRPNLCMDASCLVAHVSQPTQADTVVTKRAQFY